MEHSEKVVYDTTSDSPKSFKQFLVVIGLMVAALLMVSAWILHLKWSVTWTHAFLISIGFVIIEFLLNTTCTRYGKYYNVFTPGQMATLSIIFGIIFIFIMDKTVFKDKLTSKNDSLWKDITGFVLISVGTGLVLWEKN